MRSALTAIVCIFSYLSLSGQKMTYMEYIDSFRYILESSVDIQAQVSAANEIAARHLYSNPDTAIHYAELALELATRTGDVFAELWALGIIGEANIYKGNLPRALEISLKAFEAHDHIPEKERFVGPAYYNLSELYFQIGDYEKALFWGREMTRMSRDHNFDRLAGAYGRYCTAQVFLKTGKLDSALILLEESLPVFEKDGDKFFKVVYNDDVWPGYYNLRSKILLALGRQKEALDDLFKVIRLTADGEYFHTSNTYNDIALLYQKSAQKDSAIFYAEKGLNAARNITYNQAILVSCQILGEEYESVDPAKALFYVKLANETKGKLYGSGNIQIIQEIIAKDEQKRKDLAAAESAFRNRLRSILLLAGILFLTVLSIILFRGKQKSRAHQKVLEKTLANLKATQAQLIQSEKMASLGELTAGIAHEIQNPLNFVNNFSEVSGELIEEMKEELSQGDITEGLAIADDLKENLERINHHGKRADAIVKGMLQHSRTSSGERVATDLNALADEYLRLAYHGLRARDSAFNAAFDTHFDPNLPRVNVLPQDIGRVLLNLINNAFQAVYEKSQQDIDGYKPAVTVTSRLVDDAVEISVEDNGSGIPEEIRGKIFQPFFTTKPTGQGTGLGLSLSYDIVKAHNGKLKIDSVEGNGSAFTISLPINSDPLPGSLQVPR